MASLILIKNVQLAKQRTGGILGVLYLRTVSYSTDDPRPLKNTELTSMKRGTGGRSSFSGIVATIFGASGFVGRYVVNKLGKIGTQMIIPYRGDFSDVARLKVAGDLGQVLFQFYHLCDEEAIHKAVKYSNVVINLVGRDFETKNFKFNDVHVAGAARLARIAYESGVDRFIHVSSLNGDPKPKGHVLSNGSQFLRSKYEGELAVRSEFPRATIIRPADIYGSEDRFLRYYAHVWRRQFRGMPLWYKGEQTVKQPVFISDVAQAIVNCAKDPDTAGKVYQAVGPKRYKLSELVDWFHRVMRKDEKWWGYYRYDMRYDPFFQMRVRINELICPSFPIADLHWERIERECVTDRLERGVATLEDLGVQLTPMENQVPWELRPFRAAQYYNADLNEFEKPSPPHALTSTEEKRLFA